MVDAIYMTHAEMLKKVTDLRKIKRGLLADLEIYDYCMTDEIRAAIKTFAAKIPATNAKIAWIAGLNFEAAYQELRNDAAHIDMLLDKARNDYAAAKQLAEKVLENVPAEEVVVEVKRGGKREGAGRKSKGVKKVVSIVLPQKAWDSIDNLIQEGGDIKSYGQYFRVLVTGEL